MAHVNRASQASFGERVRTDRRLQSMLVAGAVVLVAVVVFVFTGTGGGGSDEGVVNATPLHLTMADPSTAKVYGSDGQPTQLAAADRDAVQRAIEGYLQAATVTPLDQKAHPKKDETGAANLAPWFTTTAGPRLSGTDHEALADDGLPAAKHGVSTDFANATGLAALVQNGKAQLVTLTIDVQMTVRTGKLAGQEADAVVVHRQGDLLLQPVNGQWKIGGYHLKVTRDFGNATTTTKAAFGA